MRTGRAVLRHWTVFARGGSARKRSNRAAAGHAVVVARSSHGRHPSEAVRVATGELCARGWSRDEGRLHPHEAGAHGDGGRSSRARRLQRRRVEAATEADEGGGDPISSRVI
ncbi:hypothetical protein BDA96_09G090300 [Sorghum bicolor]|uniref:Uncharacterized protein n=1 Tax=Sorghum bicolor TaxID=4558 RepID=A0A921QBV6_SORBI|nr:hypothetical protein BDA96_09G090300 [Sorghum bicolor]